MMRKTSYICVIIIVEIPILYSQISIGNNIGMKYLRGLVLPKMDPNSSSVQCDIDCSKVNRETCVEPDVCGKCLTGYTGKNSTNSECNPITIFIFFAIFAVVIVGCCIALYYLSCKENLCASRSEYPVERPNRCSLKDSFLTDGLSEWQCVICLHHNHPQKKNCVMCDTPQDELPILTDQTQGARKYNDKVLSQKQRGARRRHLWKRMMSENGSYVWIQQDPDFGFTSLESPKDYQVLERQISREDGDKSGMDIGSTIDDAIAHNDLKSSLLPRLSMGYLRINDENGNVLWKPADQATLSAREDSRIDCPIKALGLNAVSSLPFTQKSRWFLRQAGKTYGSANCHFYLKIRREHILEDSMAVIKLMPENFFRYRIRIEFDNESGIDLGGLYREWIQLVCAELFKESRGLFIKTHEENLSYWINPLCNINDKVLAEYFRFFGRFVGKILLDGQILCVHLALPLLKHIIGVPISPSDLEFLDKDIYNTYKWLKACQDIGALGLDFTCHGNDLKEGGSTIDATNENKEEYIFCFFKYYMLDSVSKQLTAFLEGLQEAIPSCFLQVFDYKELELLLCGLPTIDVTDWMKHTEIHYMKDSVDLGSEFEVICWFWETVKKFSNEERARLLQFTTGCSRVPVEGFKGLQCSDGRLQQFTIQIVPREHPPFGLYPKAQTCFNRILLPCYHSERELSAYLTLVVNSDITGFSMH